MRKSYRFILLVLIAAVCFVSLALAASTSDLIYEDYSEKTVTDSLSFSFSPTQTDVLHERLSYASEILDSQNWRINFLSILIALLTIVLPVLTYLLGIKPSQDAIKELNATMDGRINEYMTEFRNKQINEAIKYLRENPNEIMDGTNRKNIILINFLLISEGEKLSRSQLAEIFFLLTDKEHPMDPQSALVLSVLILQSGENDYSTRYFKHILDTTKDLQLVKCAVRFYIDVIQKPDIVYKYMNSLIPSTLDEKKSEIIPFVNFVRNHTNLFICWANDKNAIEELTLIQYQMLSQSFDKIFTPPQPDAVNLIEKFKNSYFFQRPIQMLHDFEDEKQEIQQLSKRLNELLMKRSGVKIDTPIQKKQE